VKPIFEAKLRKLADAVNVAQGPHDLGLEDHPSFTFEFDKGVSPRALRARALHRS
jgi:hypothetical protein